MKYLGFGAWSVQWMARDMQPLGIVNAWVLSRASLLPSPGCSDRKGGKHWVFV